MNAWMPRGGGGSRRAISSNSGTSRAIGTASALAAARKMEEARSGSPAPKSARTASMWAPNSATERTR